MGPGMPINCQYCTFLQTAHLLILLLPAILYVAAIGATGCDVIPIAFLKSCVQLVYFSCVLTTMSSFLTVSCVDFILNLLQHRFHFEGWLTLPLLCLS